MKRNVFFFLLLACFSAKARDKIIVAQDGTGNFNTVTAAINAVPDSAVYETVILIRSGVYKEKIVIPKSKRKIHLIGDHWATTRLTFDNYASQKDADGRELGTARTASCYIYGSDFIAENITFENAAGPVGQALAVWVGSDRSCFIKCRFLGYQDTIYTDYNARQYYKNCYIEGTTDFIFGPATAVFDHCEIFCKKGGYYITAASTPDSVLYGYVFLHCRITGDAPNGTFYLGRPWRPFARVAFIRCALAAVIRPEGWNNWGKSSNEKTAYYAEYLNKGNGARPSERVSWSQQLTEAEAKKYSLSEIFNGWSPLRHTTK